MVVYGASQCSRAATISCSLLPALGWCCLLATHKRASGAVCCLLSVGAVSWQHTNAHLVLSAACSRLVLSLGTNQLTAPTDSRQTIQHTNAHLGALVQAVCYLPVTHVCCNSNRLPVTHVCSLPVACLFVCCLVLCTLSDRDGWQAACLCVCVCLCRVACRWRVLCVCAVSRVHQCVGCLVCCVPCVVSSGPQGHVFVACLLRVCCVFVACLLRVCCVSCVLGGMRCHKQSVSSP
jgi:hypothetical protein